MSGFYTVIGVGIAGGILKQEVMDFVKAWIAYFRSGEYNLDGDKATSDWCEGCNTGTGDWFVIKITAYIKPLFPGAGGVEWYTKDENGEHRHFSSWPEWVASRPGRRSVGNISNDMAVESSFEKFATDAGVRT